MAESQPAIWYPRMSESASALPRLLPRIPAWHPAAFQRHPEWPAGLPAEYIDASCVPPVPMRRLGP